MMAYEGQSSSLSDKSLFFLISPVHAINMKVMRIRPLSVLSWIASSQYSTKEGSLVIISWQ